jgi:NAD(P)H-hydrate epimerase
MQAIEKEADSNGLTYDQMMENAGHGLADAILDMFDGAEELEAVGLVGPGNNGGDTLVAMITLVQAGWKAHAYLVKRKKDELVKAFTDAGGELVSASKEDTFANLAEAIESADVLLDGILGTGVKLPLKKDVAEALAEVNDILDGMDESPLIIAVDCPSGVDCDSGEAADETIPADITITMASVKQGLLKLPAFEFVGELQVVDIGLSETIATFDEIKSEVAEEDFIAALLPERPLDSHKGTYGTSLIVAGSVNYTGATVLAAEAAYRSGAGLVTLAIPSSLHSALAGQLPEATWLLLPHEAGVIAEHAADVVTKKLGRATALLIGPGLGAEETTRAFLEALLNDNASQKKPAARIGFVHDSIKTDSHNGTLPPLVIDADGLNLLAKIKNWHAALPATSILTPHPGEMSTLTGLAKEEIQENRQAIASKYAKQWGHVVVLKGAFTVIASPDGRVTLIPIATPALARAGTGDVLAGIIVGLRAQGLDAYDAAVAGAWIHAQAGLYAADDLGTAASVMASDVLNSISDVISDLE